MVGFPDGSMDEEGCPVLGWEPEGWAAEKASLIKAGHLNLGEAFYWPKHDGLVYKSRTTAKKRADLLGRYGATAHIVKAALRWEWA